MKFSETQEQAKPGETKIVFLFGCKPPAFSVLVICIGMIFESTFSFLFHIVFVNLQSIILCVKNVINDLIAQWVWVKIITPFIVIVCCVKVQVNLLPGIVHGIAYHFWSMRVKSWPGQIAHE